MRLLKLLCHVTGEAWFRFFIFEPFSLAARALVWSCQYLLGAQLADNSFALSAAPKIERDALATHTFDQLLCELKVLNFIFIVWHEILLPFD